MRSIARLLTTDQRFALPYPPPPCVRRKPRRWRAFLAAVGRALELRPRRNFLDFDGEVILSLVIYPPPGAQARLELAVADVIAAIVQMQSLSSAMTVAQVRASLGPEIAGGCVIVQIDWLM